jgi:uncharacterized small protein (DUF1192 family)
LRNAIAAARDEIDRLDAENNESVGDSAEDESRRRRIAILEADIANCDREIQILSDGASPLNRGNSDDSREQCLN